MKGSSKLFCGLLVSYLCLRGSTEQLSVIQCPANITVYEGTSAQIKCCWINISRPLKVSWLKNEKTISAGKQHLQEQSCSTLNLTNITKNDTGNYVCKVIKDIPYLLEVMGNKTVLTVTEKCNSGNATTKEKLSYTSQTTRTAVTRSSDTSSITTSNLILPLSLVTAIGLLTFCLAFIFCKKRNSCKNAEQMDIQQIPQCEGEEHANMEERLSTNSSQGSIQWYHVPLYWSYFDVQRDEDQSQPE
ncbi:uncharacterized protein LOC127627655 isoform X2 [Xyrauchen texanus]|uniref:uncharacterized protein LOC127627655 isoform X2 n=1 Tax=Xyrauchen texanus TaxID=154827 RepID=UPI0022421BD5|nr:uncharacterized protein LOC127627655 isoform X2 [Xyrauchen texanus]